MQPKRPTVSVIIPTLNEARNLPLVLPYLPHAWIDEVILVDGRSTDDTVEVARRLLPSIRVVLEQAAGKGAAMRAGFAAATGDILVTMDADGSNDPREIPRLIQRLLEGADFVKGSRFAPGGGTTDMPRYRKWGNRALGWLVNVLFNGDYTDLCYGYHAFWRHCLPTINHTIACGFEVDTAIYVRVLRERLRVAEVPSFEGYRFFGVSNLRTIPDGWRILKTILSECWRERPVAEATLYRGFRGYQPAETLRDRSTDAVIEFPTPVEVIYNLSHELAAQPDPHERLKRLLDRVLLLIGGSSGSLVVLDQDGLIADGVLAYEGEMRRPTPMQISETLQNGLAGWVVENRQAALVSSTVDDARWLRRPWELQQATPRSAISVPLTMYDRPIGVLTLVHNGPQHFTQKDLALLVAIAIGISLSAAGLFLQAPRANNFKSRHSEEQPAAQISPTVGQSRGASSVHIGLH
jgi:hypothetical protein